jgi:hypothetical protein
MCVSFLSAAFVWNFFYSNKELASYIQDVNEIACRS